MIGVVATLKGTCPPLHLEKETLFTVSKQQKDISAHFNHLKRCRCLYVVLKEGQTLFFFFFP